jgi:hypothetical protein
VEVRDGELGFLVSSTSSFWSVVPFTEVSGTGGMGIASAVAVLLTDDELC